MTHKTVVYKYGTGNPVEPNGSFDVRDGIDNLQSFDAFMNATEDTYNQRDGDVVGTISGANNRFDAQILNMGFTRAGTFAIGATLTNPRQTLLWDTSAGGDGQEYGWSGTFPKVVPPASTPASTGGIAVGAWMSRFDPELRVQSRESTRRTYAKAGFSLVAGSFEIGGTLTSSVDVLLHEASGKAFSSTGPYPVVVAAGTNPSSLGFTDRSGKFDYETSVIDLGAVPDYILPDGSINPSPTDNWAIFNDILNGIDKYQGMSLFIPSGSYFCSQSINVVYQTNNPWQTSFGASRLNIRGAGLNTTNIVFPSVVNNGLAINTSSLVLSNLFISGFSLVRLGFNPDDYQARPYIETFDFSGEPLFGVGLDVRQNGYIGGIHDIGISGFYVAMRQRNVYNGKVSRIFVPSGDAIYGFLGTGNTTLSIADSNFWGYQCGFCSQSGYNDLKNVVCEGNFGVFTDRPDLLNKFAGHGFWQTGGFINFSGACYTEKLCGYSRGFVDCSYEEVGGQCSNGLGYAYNAPYPGDGLSPALKAMIDVVNPNLISTFYKLSTGSSRRKGSVSNSYSTVDDVYWIEDGQLGTNLVYTNCFAMHGTIRTTGGFSSTLAKVFKKHIPSDFSFMAAFYTFDDTTRYQENTRFTGYSKVSQEYNANYSGYGIWSWDRRWDPAAPKATIGVDVYLNLDGTISYKYVKKDAAGVIVETTTPLIMSKTAVTAEQLFIRGDNGSLYRIRVNTSGQVIASAS